MPPLNYQIGVDVLTKKARGAIESLDRTMKNKFQSMTGYQSKINRESEVGNAIFRRMLQTEKMGLKQTQKLYEPILSRKYEMKKVNEAWQKSETKTLTDIRKQLKLNKTEQAKYLKRIGESDETIRRSTKGCSHRAEILRKTSKIEVFRTKSLKEMGSIATKTLREEEEGLRSLTTAQRKQLKSVERASASYKRHFTAMGKVKAGMSGLLAGVKKAGMIFLTVLGPLFLVGAAMRTVQQLSDYLLGSFIKLEDALYELRKTAGISLKAMWEIGAALEHLTAIMPLSAEELANIAATAGRLGIRGKENIIEFTKAVAMMATATDLTAEDAAQALGKLTAAFDLPIENVKYLGSVINELSNVSASSASEIVEAMKRVGAAGKLMGFTAEEVAAMTATLIDMGHAAERSGTRLRRMMTEMARKSHKMAEQMDVDAVEWSKSIEENPARALEVYLKYLKDLKPIQRQTEAHDVFGKVGGFALISLAQNLTTYQEHLKIANREMMYGTSLMEEFGIAVGKTSAQLKILASRTEIARRAIGEDLIPVAIAGKKVWADFLMALSGSTYGMEYMKTGADLTTTSILKLNQGLEISNKDINDLEKGLNCMGNNFRLVDSTWAAGIITLGEFQEETRDLSQEMKEANVITKLLDSGTGALEKRFYTIGEGLDDYKGGIGAVVNALGDSKLLTNELKEGQDDLFDSYNKLGKARDYVIKTTNELNKLEEEEPENAEAIVNAQKKKEDATRYLDYAIIKADEHTIQYGKDVYKASQNELAADRISQKHLPTLKNFVTFHEDLTDATLEGNDARRDELKGLAIENAVVSGNTDLWRKWTSIVSKANVKTIRGFEEREKAVDFFHETLHELGYTIEWIAGQPQILSDDSIKSIEEGIEKTDKMLDSTDALTYGIADLIQIERERETVLGTINKLQDKLIRSSFDYTSIIFDEVDVERELAKIRRTIPSRLKEEIGLIDDEYASMKILIEANDEGTASTLEKALADKYSAEATDMLGKANDRNARRRLDEISYIGKYIEMQGQSLKIDSDKIKKDKEMDAGHKILIGSEDIVLKKALETDEAIKTITDHLGIYPSELEPIGNLIEEAITVPEMDTTGIDNLATQINEILTQLELPEISVDELKNILKTVQETSEALPPTQVQVGLDPEYFVTAWNELKGDIEPLSLRVKMIPELGIKEALGIGEEKVPSAQSGISYVPKTSLYQLHKGESVLTKKETQQQNVDSHELTVNMGGVVLSEGYDVKKFLNDMETYSLSRL